MRIVRVDASDCLTESQADALGGELLGDDSYDHLIAGEDADVYKPDGSLLLSYRASALPLEDCRAAYGALRTVYFDGGNRGLASGKFVSPKMDAPIASSSGTRSYRLKKDGTASKTSNAVAGRNMKTSAVVGYFDRTGRYPYCRMTAFNLDHPERFAAALPFIRSADRAFAEAVPERHAAQAEVVRRTRPEFVIHGTAFTTLTVNRNWQTAVHKDSGDLRAGFGVMAALRAGEFDGCYLCFPRFRVAVDMATRGVLMADVHEWHGNTPFQAVPGRFERISCVFYYRERMAECGSPAEELETVKRRNGSRKGIKG